MELAAESEGKSPMEIAYCYTRAWLENEAFLNILPVDVMPKATDHIPEMISLTERLLENGLAFRDPPARKAGGEPSAGRWVNEVRNSVVVVV